MEFSYFMPVRLLFGANVIDQLGTTAKSYGTHALIVTGRSSTKRSGLLDRSIALLEAAGVRATVFNKVEPNPLTTTVMEGAALAREQGCDLVIGMGGGSMMDAAKAEMCIRDSPEPQDECTAEHHLRPDGQSGAQR